MNTLIDFLAHRTTTTPLPHEGRNLPPEIRAFRAGKQKLSRPPRVCAVLLAVFEDSGQLHVPFMQRPHDGTVHAGQISFPGGGKEPHDRHLFDTARREAEEEIGIQVAPQQIIGTLSDIYIPPSHSLVTPVLAHLPKRPSGYVPDPREVAEVLEFSLSDLRKPEHQTQKVVTLPDRRRVPFFAVRIGEHEIWGATGRILSEFFLLLDEWEQKLQANGANISATSPKLW